MCSVPVIAPIMYVSYTVYLRIERETMSEEKIT